MENEIKLTWYDLPEDDREKALKNDLYFEELKKIHPEYDLSERDRILNKYKVKLVCRLCDGEVEANFMKPFPTACPYCHRGSLELADYDSATPNPAFIADWLLKHYQFLTTADQDAEIYMYDESTGIWSPDKANTVIEQEAKILLRAKLKVQDISNIKLHIRARTYRDRGFLGPAVRYHNGIAINFKNGVLRISDKVEFTAHSPDDYFTGVLPVDFNPKLEAFPEKTLEFIWSLCENPYDFTTLLEGLAYPLLPGYPIQQVLTLVGTGGNGKSTYLALLQMLYGEQNAASITLQQLSSAEQQQPFLLARLYGKLLNVADDLPSKPVKDVGFFKQLTGNSTVEAEHKFGGRFSFVNTAKFYFAANQMPAVSDDTIAYWRRFCFVEFTRKINNPRPMDEVLKELREEIPALLNVLVAIVLPQMIGKSNFTFADTPEITQEIYELNSNSAQRFAQTELESNMEAETLKSDLLIAYQKWCEEHDYIQVSEKRFWQTIKMEFPQADERKIQKEGKRIRTMVGIRLTPSKTLEDDEITNKMLEKEGKLRQYVSNMSNVSSMSNIFPYLINIREKINMYYIRKNPDIPENLDIPDSNTAKKAKETDISSKPMEAKLDAQQPAVSAKQAIVGLLKQAGGGAYLSTKAGCWEYLYVQLPNIAKGEIDSAMEQLHFDGTIFEPEPGFWKLNGYEILKKD